MKLPEIISIAKKTFTSNINIDDGYRNHSQGDREYTMELFSTVDGYYVEWDIPSMDETLIIGLEHNNKILTGYDAVFELPIQAIELLRENGFTVDKEEFELV